MKKRVVVGITGASGSLYAVKLIKALMERNIEVHIIMTAMGRQVLRHECGFELEDHLRGELLHWHDDQNLFASVASGSFLFQAMVIVPCSMNTLGSLAGGLGNTLLTRVAAVTLKERRTLVVVPRETPLNVIQLENMLRLARAGAVLLPAAPGFYFHPKSLDDMVAHVAGKILDALQIENSLFRRWPTSLDSEDGDVAIEDAPE
jgi:4-hydroxy-3-polyprenylbenzoate decarboxylase